MKLTIELRSKPDKTQELHQTLQALLPSIRREKANLTSNVQTSTVRDYPSHPMRRFMEHGLLATINTDDPGISGITLQYEYEIAAPAAGLSVEQIHLAQRNALGNRISIPGGKRSAVCQESPGRQPGEAKMIALSVGMPRAGSGWYYNLTHDLVCAAGGVDARQVRRRYRLQRILTEVNCNIGALTPPRLLAVLPPMLLGNTFAIKAHAGPTPLALSMIRRGLIRVTYIYRDPRDALLSAFDYGQRAAQAGRVNAFSHLTDFETALDFMLLYVKIWQAWMACEQALHVRYEDLLSGYDQEVHRLVSFLAF